MARIIGKRPVYLISGAFGLSGALWNALGTSYGSILGSRVLYGFGAGAFEALVLATIGDMYFVRELRLLFPSALPKAILELILRSFRFMNEVAALPSSASLP